MMIGLQIYTNVCQRNKKNRARKPVYDFRALGRLLTKRAGADCGPLYRFMYAVTRSLTRAPSARPVARASTAFMSLPMSRGPEAPVSWAA